MTLPMSPCVGICQLDEETGQCRGCSRTRDEVARWPRMSAAEQAATWQALAERRAGNPDLHTMLPWDAEARRASIEAGLSAASHSWAVGTWGAVAEFMRDADEPFERRPTETGFEAETPRGAIRIERIDKARAFLGEADTTVAFSVHKARTERRPATTVTDLGCDAGAVHTEHCTHRLFDLGLGQPHVKFCVRTADAGLTGALEEACGMRLFDGPPCLRERLRAASPHRVVVSALGRIEVYGPIAEHGSRTPDGPHTHLLPDLLAENRTHGPSLHLPATYFPALYLYRVGPAS